tara:strand:+ start:273 stop:506 length:234 start_codon:yes stop_codon:yes gene_type:complete
MFLGFVTEITAFYFFVKNLIEGTVFEFIKQVKIMFVSKGWLAFFFAIIIFTAFTYLTKKDKKNGKEEGNKEEEQEQG